MNIQSVIKNAPKLAVRIAGWLLRFRTGPCGSSEVRSKSLLSPRRLAFVQQLVVDASLDFGQHIPLGIERAHRDKSSGLGDIDGPFPKVVAVFHRPRTENIGVAFYAFPT